MGHLDKAKVLNVVFRSHLLILYVKFHSLSLISERERLRKCRITSEFIFPLISVYMSATPDLSILLLTADVDIIPLQMVIANLDLDVTSQHMATANTKSG